MPTITIKDLHHTRYTIYYYYYVVTMLEGRHPNQSKLEVDGDNSSPKIQQLSDCEKS